MNAIKMLQAVSLLIVGLAFPVAANAQFTYTTNADGTTVTITGYTGPGGNVTIPTNINGFLVTSIGKQAFLRCTSLISVTIPNSVTNIGVNGFLACSGLTNINVDANNQFYSSMNGVLFDKAQTTLIQYPCNKAGSYIIPDSVTNIVFGAFYECIRLTSVTIPNSVTSIGAEGFYRCTNLSSVTIPDSVNNIGADAFYGCIRLTSITIPNSVTSIGEDAFSGCTSLSSVTIPDSVNNIGVNAFYGCSGLTTINVDAENQFYSSMDGVLFDKAQTTLIQYPWGKAGSYIVPNSVTNIGVGAFYECPSLTSVTIPNSIASIGEDAFSGCYSLTNVTIPNSVASIGAYAFDGCSSLTSVTIPNSVTNIGYYAFASCPLTGVYFQGNAPTADSTVFIDDSSSLTAYYLPGTTGWDAFASNAGIAIAVWRPQIQSTGTNFGMESNQFGFNINWASGMPVVVEASPSLPGGTWTPLVTNTLSSWSLHFTDPQWKNYPSRFYRVRSQ
jgi:hypothetical protein